MSTQAKIYFPYRLAPYPIRMLRQVLTSWNNLSLHIQSIWDFYATVRPIRDKSGHLVYLSGFDLYLQSNVSLINLGLNLDSPFAPPVGADTVPDYEIIGYSNSLHVDFFPHINFINSHLCIYASAPFVGDSSKADKSVYYVASFNTPNAGIFDITSAYANSQFINWNQFYDSKTVSIKFYVCLVNSVTGIASDFKELVYSFDNSPGINYNTYASNFVLKTIPSFSGTIWQAALIPSGVAIATNSSNALVYRSTDFGQNFSSIGNLSNTNNKIGCFASSSGLVLVGLSVSGAIYRSYDSGSSFSFVGNFSPATQFQFFCSGYGPRILGAGAMSGRVAYSDDSGTTWNFVLVSGVSGATRILRYLENGIILCFGITTRVLLRSVDNGLSWSIILSNLTAGYFYDMVYCGNGIVIAVFANTYKLWKSVDYGLTWSPITTYPFSNFISQLLYVGNGYLVGILETTAQLVQSFDYGDNWSLVGDSGLGSYSYSKGQIGKGVGFMMGYSGGKYLVHS